jgi:tyrosine-protein phosphatase SIW14
MTSKRNSRAHAADRSRLEDDSSSGSNTPFRSRRSSLTSSNDSLSDTLCETGELQRSTSKVVHESTTVNHSHDVVVGQDMLIPEATMHGEATVMKSSTTYTMGAVSTFAPAPMAGRPDNFGEVIPGVYRSSYPKIEDFGYLRDLNLKTIVTLVKTDEVDTDLQSFSETNGIRQAIFHMKGTKKETIPLSTMNSILEVILDRRNYPLLLHCNHGKHRTGCVVAVVRKTYGWDLHRVVDEYRTFASPKVRECDVEYIRAFEVSSRHTHLLGSPRFTRAQLRNFGRILFFSSLAIMIWLVSGSQLVSTRQSERKIL